MSKTKRNISWIVIAVLAICYLCGVLYFGIGTRASADGAQAAGTWSALNAASTTVTGNKIKTAVTDAGSNKYAAVYSETIDLSKGFKIDFTIDSFQGEYGTGDWPAADLTNSVMFALTAEEASETAQNAYIFFYSKDGNNVKLMAMYNKDFKLENGKLTYDVENGYHDRSTRNPDFEASVAWQAGQPMSLSGGIVTGLPTFWMNGGGVSPFGGSMFNEGDGKNEFQMLELLRGFYNDFNIADTSSLHLYAFSNAREDQDGEFAVTVSNVATEYDVAHAGWVALDEADITTTDNYVDYTNLHPLMEGSNRMSRIQLVYDRVFDLNSENIEFMYSMNSKPGWVSMFRIAGAGMYQLTSEKNLVNRDYDSFSYKACATVGVYEDFSVGMPNGNAQAFGLAGGSAVTGIASPQVSADGEWATWTGWFGKNGNGDFEFKINGTTVKTYSESDIKSVVGDELKAVLMVLPNNDFISKTPTGTYRYYDYMNMIGADKTHAEYQQGGETNLEFNLTKRTSTVSVAKVMCGNTELTVGDDYTVSDNKIAFTADYLNGLEVQEESYVYTVVTSAGTTLELSIKLISGISFNVDNSVLSGNVKSMQDITVGVTMEMAGDEIRSVKLGDIVITDINDDNNGFTVSSEILNGLHVGEYKISVITKYSTGALTVNVNSVATEAPVWTDAQPTLVEVNLANAETLVLNADLKDAVDYYLLFNGSEYKGDEITIDKNAGTVTILKAFVENLSVGDNKVIVVTDGGRTDELNLRASILFDKWNVDYATKAPVENDKGELTLTGSSGLTYKQHINLADGYTIKLRFDEIYDNIQNVNGGYAQIEISIFQGDARYNLYIRTIGDGSPDQSFDGVQLHQHTVLGGGIMDADVIMGSLAPSEVQTWSVKVINNTVLTMWNGRESRVNGKEISAFGGVVFDDATITVKLAVGDCKDHKDEIKATVVSFGEFDEAIADIPVWAQSSFLQPIAAPVLSVQGNKVVWDDISGASQYIVYIDGEPAEYVSKSDSSFDFSAYGEVGDKLTIQVKAVSDGTMGGDSTLSQAVEVTVVSDAQNTDNNKKRGCKSSVVATSSLVIAVSALALAGVMTLVRRKKERN